MNLISDVKVRKAVWDDIDFIMTVEDSAFLPKDRYLRERIETHFLSGEYGFDRQYFVAEKRGLIVGYSAAAVKDPASALLGNVSSVENRLNVSLSGKKVGVLTSIGVLRECKGMGIGKYLLQARLDWIRERVTEQDEVYVFAHSWPNGGFPQLSVSFGFQKVGDWNGKRQYSDGSFAELYCRKMECGLK